MAWIIDNPLIVALIIGFLLDSLLGDPMCLPHPIRWFGSSIAWFEAKFNYGQYRFVKGLLSSLALIFVTFVLLFFLFEFLVDFSIVFIVISSLGVFYGIANHGLIKESWRVEVVLKEKGLEKGREQLSRIVGRDTSILNTQQIRTAVLETLAENLSDGVVAPLFYYAIGGVPLMLTYKMAQTMDSMWGYESDKYEQFGKFAARFDDVLNFIPARLTALMMVLITFSWRGFIYMFSYGSKHASPNAGYPESALAGILNLQFGGPNIYQGKLVDKPYIGSNTRLVEHNDIIKACIVNAAVALLSVGLIGFFLSTLLASV